jgi:hypothetical protein
MLVIVALNYIVTDTGFCNPKYVFSFQVNKKFIILKTNTEWTKLNGKFSLVKYPFLHFSQTKINFL